jgi:uncharacterized membrane protein
MSPSNNACPARPRLQDAPHLAKQTGVISWMFVSAMFVILGFLALALDLSLVTHRKMELQNVADTVALSAAHELDGTATGITDALEIASQRFLQGSDRFTYHYGKATMAW